MSNLTGTWFLSGARHPILADDFYSIVSIAQHYATEEELLIAIEVMQNLMKSGMVINDELILHEWVWSERVLDAITKIKEVNNEV